MMKQSKLWAAASDSDEDEDEDDEEEEQVVVRTGKYALDESSSESEDEVRVAKSQKDRAWDTMRDGVVRIRNARKTQDWSVVQDEFDNVNKKMEKSKMLIKQNGIPNFYIKMLAEVEDDMLARLKDKESFNKMKKAVQIVLNRMKLTVKKHNMTYAKEIADYRENPQNYESEKEESDDEDEDDEDEEEESEDDEPVQAKAKSKVVKKAKGGDDDDSEDDSLFGDDDDEDDDDTVEEDARASGPSGMRVIPHPRWLKQTPTNKPAPAVVPTGKKTENPQQDATTPKVQVVEKKVAVVEVITEEILDKRLSELMASRGRKGTDPRELLRQLEVLSKAARTFGPRREIPVLMHLISAMYDAHRVIDDYMDLQQWRTCFRCLMRITSLLEANHDFVLDIMPSEDVTDLVLAAQINTDLMKKRSDEEEFGADESKGEETPSRPGAIKVVGSLESFVVRLEDEYTKSLQQINPHTTDYVIRLSDEASLIELAEAICKYYIRIGENSAASTVALMHVEHLYYKHDTVAAAVQRAHVFNKTWGRFLDLHPACTSKKMKDEGSPSKSYPIDSKIVHPAAFLGYPKVDPPHFHAAAKLEELCQFIFKHGDERCKTRTLLCSVFHHALHDRYYRARDLFLISHIQDAIDKADIKTQILYNRALATLGLSAFRIGLIQKAHDCLSGICSGKVRELLAQGQARWHDKDVEQERVERRRQIPYHMHINPDLLDCCHLTCAMLLELPNMARASFTHQNAISRQFRKYLQNYNRQVFTGPPENTREHVLAAAKAIVAGEWQRARGYIVNLEAWNLIPNDGGAAVKEMLSGRIKEEAVRTYLFTHGATSYTSLSLSHICETFDMEPTGARRIISRMIFNKEIAAAWEHPADTLVLHKTEPSALQTLSLHVAEKVANLVDSNERFLDPLAGGVFGHKEEWSRDGAKKPWPPGGREGGGGGRGGADGGRGGYEGRGRGRGDREGRGGYEQGGGRGGRGEGGRGGFRGDRENRDGGGRGGGRGGRGGGRGEQKNAWGGAGGGGGGRGSWTN